MGNNSVSVTIDPLLIGPDGRHGTTMCEREMCCHDSPILRIPRRGEEGARTCIKQPGIKPSKQLQTTRFAVLQLRKHQKNRKQTQENRQKQIETRCIAHVCIFVPLLIDS
jgi:hypothetical protein